MADKQYLDGLVQDYIQNNERGLTKPIGRVYSPLVYRACQTVSLSAVAIGIAVSVRAPMTGVLSLGIATVAALIGFIVYRAVWQAVEIAARNARAFAKLMLLTGVDRQTRMAAVQKYMILRMPLTAKHWYEKRYPEALRAFVDNQQTSTSKKTTVLQGSVFSTGVIAADSVKSVPESAPEKPDMYLSLPILNQIKMRALAAGAGLLKETEQLMLGQKVMRPVQWMCGVLSDVISRQVQPERVPLSQSVVSTYER